MERSDFIERVSAVLDDAGFPNDIGRIDILDGREGICVREVSRQLVAADYAGEKTYSVIYQIAARYRDEEEAEGTIWRITSLLEGVDIPSDDGSYEFDSQEVYASPQELSIRETMFYAWQVRFQAEIRQIVR